MAILAEFGLLNAHKSVSEEERELSSEIRAYDRPFNDFSPANFNRLRQVNKSNDQLKYFQHLTNKEGQESFKIQYHKGTTTLAFKFSEGVLVAVDSRCTIKNKIVSSTTKKVLEINPYILGTMAGTAADCSFWERYLATECRLFELRYKEPISVAAASKIFRNITYRNTKDTMQAMIIGYDKLGPSIFYVSETGLRVSGDQFSLGSGRDFAHSCLQDGLESTNHKMTIDEAEELGKKAVYHATVRDMYSGGVISVYYVGPDGWQLLSKTDVSTMSERSIRQPPAKVLKTMYGLDKSRVLAYKNLHSPLVFSLDKSS